MGRKNPSVDDVELLAAHAGGAGLRRLSKMFGMSRTGLAKRLKRLGAVSHASPERKLRACLSCGVEIWGDKKMFCSRSCSATYHMAARQKFRECAACGEPHKNDKFCSYSCSASQTRLPLEERMKRRRLRTLLGVRRYQARRYQQTPADADQHQIKEIYTHCPEGCEVDHVIPISKGGLHHQLNLQYLPKLDNRRKSNKLDYTPVAERLGT